MLLNKIIKNTAIILLVFGFSMFCFAATAPAKKETTLAEVVEKVLTRHPALEASRHLTQATKEEAQKQKAYRFPLIDLSAAGGREGSHNGTTIANVGNRLYFLTRKEASLGATQLLFDGFESRKRYQAALSRHQGATVRLLGKAEELALRAVEIYIDLLRRRTLVEVARETTDVHKNILSAIKKREKAGFDTGADVFQAEARLSLAETRLATQEGDLANTISAYLETVGEPPVSGLQFPEMSLPSLSVEIAIEKALKENPAVKATQADLETKKAEMEASKGPFYPRLELELKGTRNEDVDGVSGPNDDVTAMLRMRYNLFRGGADSARYRQAIAEYTEAKFNHEETMRNLRENIRTTFDVIKTAQQQIVQEKKHTTVASKLVETYRAQLQIGTRTLLALLDAENERFSAAANIKNQEYILLFTKYQLLAEMGTLLETLKVKPPRL